LLEGWRYGALVQTIPLGELPKTSIFAHLAIVVRSAHLQPLAFIAIVDAFAINDIILADLPPLAGAVLRAAFGSLQHDAIPLGTVRRCANAPRLHVAAVACRASVSFKGETLSWVVVAIHTAIEMLTCR